jgi:hypothetical protein
MPSRVFVGGFGLEFGNDEVEQPVLRAVPRRPCSTVGAPPTPRRLNAARKATNVVRRPEARMLFFLRATSGGLRVAAAFRRGRLALVAHFQGAPSVMALRSSPLVFCLTFAVWSVFAADNFGKIVLRLGGLA